MSTSAPTIAIISPSRDVYSETFIQAHKKFLAGSVLYYYGERDNQCLEGEGVLISGLPKLFAKVLARLQGVPFGADNKALHCSWQRHGVQVVLAEYGTTGADYLDVIEAAGLPLVVHFHGFDAAMHNTLASYKDKYQRMFNYASCVIAVSEVMREKLLSLGCPSEKLVLNHYGPNPDFHALKAARNTQQFIAVGRFTEKKAPQHTIHAFNQVLKDYPLATLVMAGSGSLLDHCQHLVNDLKIGESVTFPGVITPARCIEYFQSSLAFVQHSITADSGDMEGTPLTILEASAAGLPVVSTIHAGIPDVIINGKTGLLVAENDVDAMAFSMKTLLENPDKAFSMGQAGSENIACHFSLERHIKMIDGLLHTAVEGSV